MTCNEIVTDYLVIGAGAAGMAFTDALITECEADVVMVDRRHRPGGHWNNAYPFVRLHQPSPFYGVNSRVLGNDTIDEAGPNAGFYERATAAEICDYFSRVLDETLLGSGRVRFYGMSDYLGETSGEHKLVSRLTGDATTVRVRRKVIDATYLETPIPSTHTPSFVVDPEARFVPVNDLVAFDESPRAATRSSGPARPRWTRASGSSTTPCHPTRSGGSDRATHGWSTGSTTSRCSSCRC